MAVVQGEFWTQAFLSATGVPYAGVQVTHYAAGTSTYKAVWVDSAMVTPAAQPVLGDASGRVSFYGDGAYRLVITTANGTVLYDWDGIKLTAKAATLRDENQGVSYPAATLANRGQLFARTDASGNIAELGLQKDSAFTPLFLLGAALSSIVQFGKGADLASAFTVLLGTDGNFFDVTGTATVTGLSTKPAGTVVWLRFTGAAPLTNSPGSFKLIGGLNYTTTPNDVLSFISLGSGSWEEVSRNGGIAQVGYGGTGRSAAALNGVVLGQGGGAPLAVTAAGAINTVFCVTSGGGAPLFQQINTNMIALQQVTQALLAKPSVGTPELKTATGSSSVNVPNGTSVTNSYTLNDYAFFPSICMVNPVLASNSLMYSEAVNADVGTTVARFTVQWDNTSLIGFDGTGIVRWRYVTSSDDPTIWIRHQAGVVDAVWVSDDPTPDGSPGITGGILVKAWDLDQLDIPESALHAADERIARESLKPVHRLYRALEGVAGGLPDRWLLTNCKVVNGKLVKT